jgi:dihydropteroate synthase
MGVVNVTPDSFSDGGTWFDTDAALAHGLLLARDGADIVDVGGESTRPGAARVPVEEELRRSIPVVRALADSGVAVSIDTMHVPVAVAAIRAGAVLVNDVSGGLADPQMPAFIADAGVPYVCMHWRDFSERMQERAVYDDVVGDVRSELAARLDVLDAAGVALDNVIVDPGLGFAKLAAHNWELLARLPELATLGRPILVGASRKSFLGALLADEEGKLRAVSEREDATVACTVVALLAGAWGVRVHDVRPSVDAARVVAAVQRAGGGSDDGTDEVSA